MSQRMLVIGGATVDTIIAYDEMETLVYRRRQEEHAYLLLGEGHKIEVTEQRAFTGGGATNAALSLHKQGYDTQLFCKIGDDTAGDFVIKRLQARGLSTNLMIKTDKYGTANSFIIPSLGGDRVVFAYRGANSELSCDELPLQQVKTADCLYISSISPKAKDALLTLIETAKQAQKPVAMNPGQSQLKCEAVHLEQILSGVDVLMLNLEEAETLMQSLTGLHEESSTKADNLLDIRVKFKDSRFNVREFFDLVLKLGPNIVVITNGSAGVYAATCEKIYYHEAVLADKVVNTLGAGDAFGSAFAGAIYAGKSIEDAIRYGVINGCSVVQYVDAKSGLLTADELEKRASALAPGLLSIISQT